ncbi:MAG: SH3 domain-containing protein [Coriobacteriia bacterium]
MDPPLTPSTTVPRSAVLALAKRVAALAVLLLVLTLTVSALKGYRSAAKAARSRERSVAASVTPNAVPNGNSPTAKPPAVEPTSSASTETSPAADTAVVVIGGLNFRKAPERGSVIIRPLLLDERLEIVGRSDGWLRVRDTTGLVGWVTSSERYIRVEPGGR